MSGRWVDARHFGYSSNLSLTMLKTRSLHPHVEGIVKIYRLTVIPLDKDKKCKLSMAWGDQNEAAGGIAPSGLEIQLRQCSELERCHGTE